MLFGEAMDVCPHDIDSGQGVTHWFTRWPSALLCASCGQMVASTLDEDPGRCDYCREPSPKYRRLVTPGASVAAHVVLCRVCHPAEELVA